MATREKRATSVRLSDEALRLLAALADRYGVSKTAMLELIIRWRAERDGVS